MVGKAAPELETLCQRRYDRVFLCAPDFPFVQDKTRKNDDFRARQHVWYLNGLREKKIDFAVIANNLTAHIAKVLACHSNGTAHPSR
jgi:nicotinamide riboside kinase